MEWLRILPMILLCSLLLRAAWGDLLTRTISNRLNATIAMLAPLGWLASGLPLWPGVALQVGVALLLFLLFALFFMLGAMGGGDVKLIAALALWLPVAALPQMLLVMALAGGALTILILIDHRLRRRPGAVEIPYGIAIVCGAIPIIANTILTTAIY